MRIGSWQAGYIVNGDTINEINMEKYLMFSDSMRQQIRLLKLNGKTPM